MSVERLALSVAEAAAALGVSKDAVYDAVRCRVDFPHEAGHLP
jgi:predicted DNA-binding protein YlxM (UPF0122 family)